MTVHWFSGNGSVLFGLFMGWGWRIANKVP